MANVLFMPKLFAVISVASQSLGGFLVLMLCSRFMSSENFGIFSYLLLLGNLAAIVTDYGFLSGFQIELKRFREESEDFLKSSIIVRFIFAFSFFVVFCFATQMFFPASKGILFAGCFVWLGFHFNNLLMQITTYLRFYGNFRADAIWNVVNFVFTSLSIGLAAFHSDDLTVIGIVFFSVKLFLIIAFIFLNFNIITARVSFSYFNWTKFLGYCLVNLIGFLYLNIDGVLAGYFLEADSLGEYRAIIALMMAFCLGTNVLNHYYVPIWNTLDATKLREEFFQKFRLLFFYSIIFMFVYVVWCEILLGFLFDIRLKLSLSVKLVIAFTIGLRYLSWAPGAVLLIHGYNRYRIHALLFASCVALFFAIIGFNLFGIQGGFWSLLSGHLTLFLFYMILVRRLGVQNVC